MDIELPLTFQWAIIFYPSVA